MGCHITRVNNDWGSLAQDSPDLLLGREKSVEKICIQPEMVIYVLLTPEENVDTILQKGVTRLRQQDDHPKASLPCRLHAVFMSHQWLGELKQRNHVQVAALYFRIADSEPVWAGHYRRQHEPMTAVEAMERFQQEKRPEGFEIVVPRAIGCREIYRIPHLAGVMPWRRIGLKKESAL